MTQDIQDLIAALEAAWNRGDATAFAACFDTHAEFGHIMDGAVCGRAAIAEGHAALFAGVYAVSVVTYRVAEVRPMGDWAVAVDLDQHLAFEIAGQAFEVRSRPQLVVRRDGEAWTIGAFTNRFFEGCPSMPRKLEAVEVEPEQVRRAA